MKIETIMPWLSGFYLYFLCEFTKLEFMTKRWWIFVIVVISYTVIYSHVYKSFGKRKLW
jgi:hypothetical protein